MDSQGSDATQDQHAQDLHLATPPATSFSRSQLRQAIRMYTMQWIAIGSSTRINGTTGTSSQHSAIDSPSVKASPYHENEISQLPWTFLNNHSVTHWSLRRIALKPVSHLVEEAYESMTEFCESKASLDELTVALDQYEEIELHQLFLSWCIERYGQRWTSYYLVSARHYKGPYIRFLGWLLAYPVHTHPLIMGPFSGFPLSRGESLPADVLPIAARE